MKTITVEIVPVKVDGVYYVDVNEFALIVGKTPSSVYHAAKNGAGDNKLKSTVYFNKILIDVKEIDRLNRLGIKRGQEPKERVTINE